VRKQSPTRGFGIDTLTQISGAQAALDKVALGLLDGHAHTCVIGAEPDHQNERAEGMTAAIGPPAAGAAERYPGLGP
jgi:hypothetical protein